MTECLATQRSLSHPSLSHTSPAASTASEAAQDAAPRLAAGRSTRRFPSQAPAQASTLGKRDAVDTPYTSSPKASSEPRSLSDSPPKSTPTPETAKARRNVPLRPLHFFTPRVARPDRLAASPQDSSGFSGPPFIRRVSPDGRFPTLVAGGVISGTDVEVDETLDQFDLSEISSSTKSTRPATPDATLAFPSPIPASSFSDPSHDRSLRRSFSFTRLLSGTSSLARRSSTNTNPPLSKPRHRTSRRLFSASASAQEAVTPSRDGQRPSKRRDTRSISPAASSGSRPTTSESRPRTSHSGLWRRPATPSEPASSRVGSDIGTGFFSSADEDESDFQSDTVYDSMRTGMTKDSGSNFRGQGLETLFDKPDDHDVFASQPDSVLPRLSREISPPGTVVPPQHGRRDASEEDGNASTPARTVIAGRQTLSRRTSPQGDTSTAVHTTAADADASKHASTTRLNLNLGKLALQQHASQEDINWSGDEDEDGAVGDRSTPHAKSKTLAWLDSNPSQFGQSSVSYATTHAGEVKINPFDWSEQPTPKVNDSPPRPKTEHGKKANEPRGGRAAGRAPSGFHVRSTSVPVVPDVKTKVTNKFGTWGIGSKGVSEDWDDDFTFDVPDDDGGASVSSEDPSRPTTSSAMHVPQAIREAQVKVVSNISLVREWGLLIEELKELRARAHTLSISTQKHQPTFEEVDAMIELADLDHEEAGSDESDKHDKDSHTLFQTSSPRFSFDDIDENAPSTTPRSAQPASPQRTGSGRPDEDEILKTPTTTTTTTTTTAAAATTPQRSSASRTHSARSSSSSNRPRKNSEAIALSVIEELHRRRGAADPKINRGPKMEFDTATLKNIVPYVNGLMRQFKVILREAEGLSLTPQHKRRVDDPMAFRQASVEPESPSRRRGGAARQLQQQKESEDEDAHGSDSLGSRLERQLQLQ